MPQRRMVQRREAPAVTSVDGAPLAHHECQELGACEVAAVRFADGEGKQRRHAARRARLDVRAGIEQLAHRNY